MYSHGEQFEDYSQDYATHDNTLRWIIIFVLLLLYLFGVIFFFFLSSFCFYSLYDAPKRFCRSRCATNLSREIGGGEDALPTFCVCIQKRFSRSPTRSLSALVFNLKKFLYTLLKTIFFSLFFFFITNVNCCISLAFLVVKFDFISALIFSFSLFFFVWFSYRGATLCTHWLTHTHKHTHSNWLHLRSFFKFIHSFQTFYCAIKSTKNFANTTTNRTLCSTG